MVKFRVVLPSLRNLSYPHKKFHAGIYNSSIRKSSRVGTMLLVSTTNKRVNVTWLCPNKGIPFSDEK